MIVELSCPDGSNTKEWFIIELQGLIEPRINDGSINGHAAGDISLQPVSSVVVGWRTRRFVATVTSNLPTCVPVSLTPATCRAGNVRHCY